MFDRVGEGATALDMTAAGAVPAWAFVLVGVLAVLAYTIAIVRGRHLDGTGRSIVPLALVVMLALAGWWALDELYRRDLAADRRALDARAFELMAHALTPGSSLACLDPITGDGIEEACEKALFATPETTAAAVSFVAAELSLLAAAGQQASRGGLQYGSALMNVRRSLEADRFGIVAYVLAERDGCTPEQCAAFAYLQGTGRVSANLAERPFEARLKAYAANWPARAGSGPVAAGDPATAATQGAVAAARTPSNKLYFPSSTSIPPVNIMTAEPKGPPAQDTTGAAEAGARRPGAAASPPRPAAPPSTPAASAPGASAPARAGPIQLAPAAQ
jgi:hypothetical protein